MTDIVRRLRARCGIQSGRDVLNGDGILGVIDLDLNAAGFNHRSNLGLNLILCLGHAQSPNFNRARCDTAENRICGVCIAQSRSRTCDQQQQNNKRCRSAVSLFLLFRLASGIVPRVIVLGYMMTVHARLLFPIRCYRARSAAALTALAGLCRFVLFLGTTVPLTFSPVCRFLSYLDLLYLLRHCRLMRRTPNLVAVRLNSRLRTYGRGLIVHSCILPQDIIDRDIFILFVHRGLLSPVCLGYFSIQQTILFYAKSMPITITNRSAFRQKARGRAAPPVNSFTKNVSFPFGSPALETPAGASSFFTR